MSIAKIQITKDQEVMEILNKEFVKNGWREGAIVSVIGAVDECTISNMPKDDAMKDVLTDFKEPMELSGCGEIRDGKAHIHCILGREDNSTVSGHLHKAIIKSWFVNVYVMPQK